MSTLHTRVRQWALTEGVREVHSDLLVVRTFAAHRSPRHQEHVFVAVQAVDAAVGGDAACALVAETLVGAFCSDPSLSITSALRRAFAAAHAALRRHNEHVPPAERTLVGASCVVVHDATLYIAQVQPAQAWVRHHNHVRAIPAPNDPLLADASQALGSPLYTTPELAHAPVAAGDVLVLCSRGVAEAADPEQVDALLRSGDANAVADGLYDLCAAAQVYTGHALAIEWVATAPERVGAPEPHQHAHTRTPIGDGAGMPRVLAHEQTVPTNTIAVHKERRSRGDRRGHATLRDTQPRAENTPATRRDERGSGPPSTASALPRSAPHAHRSNTSQRRPSVRPLRGISTGRPRLPVRWLATLLLACVVALVGVAVQQSRQQHTGVALAAIAQVEQSVALAKNASTPATAQHTLAAAQTTLRAEVEPLVQSGVITTSQPVVWQAYTTMLERYEQAMTTINHVVFADELQRVAALPGDAGLINRIVLGTPAQPGGTLPLFLLDRSGSRVWQAGRSTPVLENGAVIAGVPVTRLREALWRGDKLLLLERGDRTAPAYRMLYQDGERWTETKLARTDSMAPLDGDLPMATFAGNLYVWDRDTKQVWQYSAGQLSLPPTAVLGNVGNVALDKVVDIAADQRTYLLNSDGSIVVIEHGAVVQHWPAPQLGTPISTVARFVVTPDWTGADGTHHTGAIYVLDTQHERVVQFDKASGAVTQQFEAQQPGTLNQLTDLAVDEAGRMLYLANGNHVLRTPLPPLSPPAPPEPVK